MIARARACLALMAQAVGRGRVLRLFTLQVVVAILEGAGLVLLVPVIQALGGAARLPLPGLHQTLSLPVAFSLVVVVVALRAVGQWSAAVLAVDIRLTTVDRLRLGLIDDLYAADWAFLSGQRRSHLVQQLTTNVERAHSALATLLHLLVGSLVLVATAAVAVLIAPVVGGLAVLALVVVALLSARSTRGASALGRAMTERMAGFGAALSDSLASVRVMRAHDAAAAWSDLVGVEAARVREVRRSFVARSAAVGSAVAMAGVFAVLILILVGRAVGMSLAELAALAVVSTRLLTSAQGLLNSAQIFANDVPAVERLAAFREEVRAHPEQAGAPAAASTPASATGATGAHRGVPLVALYDVGVRYSDEGDPVAALNGVSLEVPRRGLVAVTGPSGAGKSTLLDVVLGLVRPSTGTVFVDGEPLLDLARWRARIGYVPQQTVLVPGSIWQNLAWSLQPGRTLTDDLAWKALADACLDEVVRGLPGRLMAPLSEIAQLSGGEQQRLSIARALVREPELLVLDEATSALDPATEARLLDSLLDGERAVLMVTHRALLGRESAVLRLDAGHGVIEDELLG